MEWTVQCIVTCAYQNVTARLHTVAVIYIMVLSWLPFTFFTKHGIINLGLQRPVEGRGITLVLLLEPNQNETVGIFFKNSKKKNMYKGYFHWQDSNKIVFFFYSKCARFLWERIIVYSMRIHVLNIFDKLNKQRICRNQENIFDVNLTRNT